MIPVVHNSCKIRGDVELNIAEQFESMCIEAKLFENFTDSVIVSQIIL